VTPWPFSFRPRHDASARTVAAAVRWADPETIARLQAEYHRERLLETLAAVRDQHPGVLEDLRRMVVST